MAKFDVANEIQHQIDDHIRMREGAMKLMSACSTLNQALETSKNLLTINARILGLMSALQKKKQQHVLEEYNRQRSSVCIDSSEDCCQGRIAVSDIRVPLMWKDNVHSSGKTGDQSYYAFALIRCGDQVSDTALHEVTSADTDIYFDEILTFNDLLPDFKMDFEIYYTVITSNEANPARQPRNSISMSMWNSRKPIHFNAPKFCLAGHVHLTVDDIRIGIISKDLMMSGKGASGVAVLGDIHEFPPHPLELWGQFCCEIAAQPLCMIKKSAQCLCQMMVDGKWCECIAELFQCAIYGWKDSSLVGKTKPDHYMKMKEDWLVSKDELGGDSSFILNVTSNDTTVLSMQFTNEKECLEWKFHLRKQIFNLVSWKVACRDKMHIEEHRKTRLSIPSTASFYDQIDIGKDPYCGKSSPHISGLVNGVRGSSGPSLNEITEASEISETNMRDSVFVSGSISSPDSTMLQTDEKASLHSDRSSEHLSDSFVPVASSEIMEDEMSPASHRTFSQTEDGITDLDQQSPHKIADVHQNDDSAVTLELPSNDANSTDYRINKESEEMENRSDAYEEVGEVSLGVSFSKNIDTEDTEGSNICDTSSANSSISDTPRLSSSIDDHVLNVGPSSLEHLVDSANEIQGTGLDHSDNHKIHQVENPDLSSDAKFNIVGGNLSTLNTDITEDMNSSNLGNDANPAISVNEKSDKNNNLDDSANCADISSDNNNISVNKCSVEGENYLRESDYTAFDVSSSERVNSNTSLEDSIDAEPQTCSKSTPICDETCANTSVDGPIKDNETAVEEKYIDSMKENIEVETCNGVTGKCTENSQTDVDADYDTDEDTNASLNISSQETSSVIINEVEILKTEEHRVTTKLNEAGIDTESKVSVKEASEKDCDTCVTSSHCEDNAGNDTDDLNGKQLDSQITEDDNKDSLILSNSKTNS